MRTTQAVVPNAPCGVERKAFVSSFCLQDEFLMHRVELKASLEEPTSTEEPQFLMHRVELKVSKDIRKPFHCRPF